MNARPNNETTARQVVDLAIAWMMASLVVACLLAFGSPIDTVDSADDLPSVWSQVDELPGATVEPSSGGDADRPHGFLVDEEPPSESDDVSIARSSKLTHRSTDLLRYAPKLPPPTSFG